MFQECHHDLRGQAARLHIMEEMNMTHVLPVQCIICEKDAGLFVMVSSLQ